jgi:hypothetical protein
MGGRAAVEQMPAAPEPGYFNFARGKSWIVERAERAGSVPTLHLVSCEDASQGETLQLAVLLQGLSRSSPCRGLRGD